ncbi:MAG TPA: hypothetical protein VNM48_00220 [Chloroflexota bacterium]|nr:hypothetical protein [Chloroflexota bacterium]
MATFTIRVEGIEFQAEGRTLIEAAYKASKKFEEADRVARQRQLCAEVHAYPKHMQTSPQGVRW